AAAARDQRRVDGLIAAVRHEDLLADVDVDPLLGPDVAWTPDGVDLVEVGGADPSPFADLPECVVALPQRHASPRRQAFEHGSVVLRRRQDLGALAEGPREHRPFGGVDEAHALPVGALSHPTDVVLRYQLTVRRPQIGSAADLDGLV